jgi:predicted permease
LGVQPLLGRLIQPSDDHPGCGRSVAVISHALWQSEFGGRSDIVGQSVPDGTSRVPIVGVTPQSFFGVEVGRQFGIARPICASGFSRTDHWWLATIGRLKPGWTRAQAQAHLRLMMPAVQQATMPTYRTELAQAYLTMGLDLINASAGVSPLRTSYRQPLWILMAISALVLLIASVNLANLLLARATARRQEFAVRLAIGGSARRLLQQVFTESALLALLGCLAALGVAVIVSRSIPPLISTTVDRIHLDLALDWQVFGFTAAVGFIAVMIVGTAPALRAARASLVRSDARGSAGNEGLALRRGLVAVQIAVTLVLVFGSLLFLRTFRNLATEDHGVHERDVVVASVFFNEQAYPLERRPAAFRTLDERVSALPGVQSVAQAFTTPMGGSNWDGNIENDRRERSTSYGNRISPGYFATLGTPILAGRDFDSRDVRGAPNVAIVNQAFAAKLFDGQPIGRRFLIPNDEREGGRELEVVGLVADQKYLDIREANARIFFTALAQDEPTTIRRYVIRSSAPPRQTIAGMNDVLSTFDPTLAVRYALLDTQIGEAMLQERLMARLSAIFGAVALMLAVVGLYGVVSYTVASRRSEIGVRVALGASRTRILSMILGDVGRMLVVGVSAGAAIALLAGRSVASLLFGVEPGDPGTLAVAIAALLVTGLAAAAGPARRAAGTDPLTTLREL